MNDSGNARDLATSWCNSPLFILNTNQNLYLMKPIAFMIFGVVASVCTFGQGTVTSRASITEIQAMKFDTTYFDNGQIETITRHESLIPASGLRFSVRKIKTVYQYDKCGNWRNTTIVFEDGDMSNGDVFGPRRWQEDKPAIKINCRDLWIKPVVY